MLADADPDRPRFGKENRGGVGFCATSVDCEPRGKIGFMRPKFQFRMRDLLWAVSLIGAALGMLMASPRGGEYSEQGAGDFQNARRPVEYLRPRMAHLPE